MDIICQECGTDNPGENRVCANCAAILRPQAAQMLSPLEISAYQSDAGSDRSWAEIRDDLLELRITPIETGISEKEADADLWPAESVFVAVMDSDADEPASSDSVPLAAEFEDDQADDVFEQSLSGVRIEDLAGPVSRAETISEPEPDAVAEVDDEPTLEPKPIAAAEPIRKADQELRVDPRIVHPASEQSRIIEFSGPAPTIAVVAEPVSVGNPAVRNWKRTLIGYAGVLLSAIILFGSGVAAGRWLIETPAKDISQPVFVPIASKEIVAPPTPEGMAFVAGGEFRMGSDEGDPLSRPAHSVTVQPFYIDLTEVTNEAYMKFVTATGHDAPANWQNGAYAEGSGTFPVTGVTWYEAAEYAAWLGKRLPTEAEWEFAARGADGRTYPWGNSWDPALANVGNTSRGIRSVGSGEKSPFGLLDMSGNVWEWTSSDAKAYPGGKEFPGSRLRLKVIRGGNWQSDSTAASSVFRGYYGADREKNYGSTGFRCVKDQAK